MAKQPNTGLPDNIVFENAQLIFRNFEGKPSTFNDVGSRNFGVIIEDPKAAEQYAQDEWNIKHLKVPEDEEGTEPVAWLPVQVGFKMRPPRITLITSTSRTVLTEDLVSQLDAVDIANADLIVRPYRWEVNGKGGIKAYLKTLFVTVDEDELEAKYNRMEMAEDDE